MAITAVLLVATWLNVATGFDPFQHLGTTTPYRTQPRPGLVAPEPPPTCRLHQVNMVLRHGTRHPTPEIIEMAQDVRERLQDACDQEANAPDWMRRWRPRFDPLLCDDLTSDGMLEHYELAQRLARRYPEVFAQPYNVAQCQIRSTQKSRAGRSASSFAFGLWHGTGDITEHRFEPTFIYTTGPLDDDAILRPFKRCPLYQETRVDPETRIHCRDYMARVVPEIVARIQARIGLPLDWALVMRAWKVFKNELALFGSSDLAHLFERDDVLALELGDDIAAYWEKGPGRSINWQMMCPLLNDVLASMVEAALETVAGRHRHLDLRFAHAETVIPLAVSLGLFKDDFGFKSDSDASRMESRQWRMTRVAPYAANIAFHLYRCDQQFMVSILHNEEPVPIPFCSSLYFCPLQTFQNHLQQFTSCCNLTEMCSLDSSGQTCHARGRDSSLKMSALSLALSTTLVGLVLGTVTGFFIYRYGGFPRAGPDRAEITQPAPYRSIND